MILFEFVQSCPPELRLGQYFYNKYLHRLKPHDRMHADTQLLYNTDDLYAFAIICDIMTDYQWEELPE